MVKYSSQETGLKLMAKVSCCCYCYTKMRWLDCTVIKTGTWMLNVLIRVTVTYVLFCRTLRQWYHIKASWMLTSGCLMEVFQAFSYCEKLHSWKRKYKTINSISLSQCCCKTLLLVFSEVFLLHNHQHTTPGISQLSFSCLDVLASNYSTIYKRQQKNLKHCIHSTLSGNA